ncbi:unnamed protein product [Phytophthora lilii]|uniref:Unnamed protein product n=1 Tax=Phytophthora lilii TaxID=2077276 RepID=A0A9W6WQ26_9STRA|nr:unnamed protein product [Phytophthora lilii]
MAKRQRAKDTGALISRDRRSIQCQVLTNDGSGSTASQKGPSKVSKKRKTTAPKRDKVVDEVSDIELHVKPNSKPPPQQIQRALLAFSFRQSEPSSYAFHLVFINVTWRPCIVHSSAKNNLELEKSLSENSSPWYMSSNVNTAREKMAARDRAKQGSSGQLQIEKDVELNALVDLEDLVKGSTEFQVAFYPLMQLQQNVRACALGEQFWAQITQRRQHVDVVVQYMSLHKGKLPSISLVMRVIALIPFSQAQASSLEIRGTATTMAGTSPRTSRSEGPAVNTN